MKKLLLSTAVIMTFGLTAQTTLFQDNFESGGGNWTLNSGGSGANDWIINNAYVGGFFTATPNQPGAITNSPNSNYLHIYNASLACALGDCQAVFLAGSGGDKTAVMTSNISTVGYTNVTFDFYYLCNGANGITYGLVEYSTNNGANWTAASPNYAGITSWQNATLTNPAWDNQAQLKFRFHWIEGASGNDPSFAVDQVLITGTSGGPANAISTTNNVAPSNWCFNNAANLTVNFTSTGTFTAGNTYTAQLSDASGSFASPVVIGSISSTANSGTINATVPAGTAAGTGYRIRVVSSNPATTGSDNGANLTINPLPNVSLGALSAVCVYNDPFTLTGGSPAGGSFSGTGVTANVFNPNTAGVGNHTIMYSYTDGNGCSASAQQSISVGACASIEELDQQFVLYPNPATEQFQLTTVQDIDEVQLIDINGKLLRTYVSSDFYSLTGIAPGQYIIKIISGERLHTLRLTKE